MNNFLKHNLEMPLTGGSSGGTGSASSEPTDIIETYKQGDIFASTRIIDDTIAREIIENDMITADEDPALFTYFQNNLDSFITDSYDIQIKNSITRKDLFNQSQSNAFRFINVPIGDFKYLSFSTSDSFQSFTDFFVVEHNKKGEILNFVFRQDGPALNTENQGGNPVNINYDNQYVTSLDKTILYFKWDQNLFVFIQDYLDGQEYAIVSTNFFAAADSSVKVTEKAVYELDQTGKTIYRYDLPSDNSTIPSTRTTVITQTDLLNAGYNGTFSGELTSDYYGWGEDFNIFTYKTASDDLLIFSNKSTVTDFYSSPLPASPTGSTIASNAIKFSHQEVNVFAPATPNNDGFGLTSILNSNNVDIVYEKNIIYQESDSRIFIGTLCQNNSNGDTLVSSTGDDSGFNVFNDLYIQKTDPTFEAPMTTTSDFISDFAFLKGPSSFLQYDFTMINDYLNNKIAFDLMSFNEKSLTFLLYKKDESNPSGAGFVDYKQNFEYLTLNDVTAELYPPFDVGQPSENYALPFYFYKNFLRDFKSSFFSLLRVQPTNEFNFHIKKSYFYQSLLSKSEVKNYGDTLSKAILKKTNAFENEIIFYSQKGYSFEPISNQKHVRTYIKK